MMPGAPRGPLVVVLVGHPRGDSYTMALADRAVRSAREAGARVVVHDPYRDGFDPVLRAEESRVVGGRPPTDDPLLARYQHDLGQADALVVVHPSWWGKPPAMIAGWLDRVLVPGVAYRLSAPGAMPTSLLRIRHVVVVNTTETPAARAAADLGDPLHDIWVRAVASYLGPEAAPPVVDRRVLADVTAAGRDQRELWIEAVAASVVTCVRALGSPSSAWPGRG